jgi:hypothetical protein
MEGGRAGLDAPKIFRCYAAASSQHARTGGTSYGSSSPPSSRSAASAPNVAHGNDLRLVEGTIALLLP